ncbi:unnamed protein product, partial [Brenthis ino]
MNLTDGSRKFRSYLPCPYAVASSHAVSVSKQLPRALPIKIIQAQSSSKENKRRGYKGELENKVSTWNFDTA